MVYPQLQHSKLDKIQCLNMRIATRRRIHSLDLIVSSLDASPSAEHLVTVKPSLLTWVAYRVLSLVSLRLPTKSKAQTRSIMS